MRNDHRILVKGKVIVTNGERAVVASNHFVDQGLQSIISQIIQGGTNTSYAYAVNPWYANWTILLGSDTTTPTTCTMTALVAQIGGNPNSKSATTKDGSADGIWNVKFSAVWNAGTVSGTLGELALYEGVSPVAGQGIMNKTQFGWTWTSLGAEVTLAQAMISRLSSADLDFSSFVIDNSVPLTVEWTVQFSFV